MADPIREALKRLLDYVQAREAARAALAAEPPAPAPAADPLQGFAADLIASQRPMDPDVAAALTPEARWNLYDGEPAPAADGEREAYAQWLDGRGAMADLGVRNLYFRAAALLRQLPPEGLEAEEYFHTDSGARIVREPCDGEPGWCWTVRNSRHVSPCTEFPTLADAWAALQQARWQEVGDA